MITKPDAFNESVMNTMQQVGDDITTDGELTSYSFDLSGYGGTGTIAIRHYNCSDMFQLNIDDITLTNAQGATVYSEDFESGTLPGSMILYDGDMDGKNWYVSNSIYCNGSYGITSASYDNSDGVLHPDNWLLIPNVPLGGTLTLKARGQAESWAAEVFGVFVSTSPDLVIPASSVIVENVTDNPYTIENLDPKTNYIVQVQGGTGEVAAHRRHHLRGVGGEQGDGHACRPGAHGLLSLYQPLGLGTGMALLREVGRGRRHRRPHLPRCDHL